MNNLPFGFEKPEHSPGFLLWQTTLIWQRLIKKALEPFDINHPQFVILATLLWYSAHSYDTTQINIATWTKLDKMTVSKSIKYLISAGYVNRVEHKVDTRAKSVSLTTKGKSLIKKVIPIVEQVDSEFFGRLSGASQQSALKILSVLSNDS